MDQIIFFYDVSHALNRSGLTLRRATSRTLDIRATDAGGSAVTSGDCIAAATRYSRHTRYFKITCQKFCYINIRISNFAYNYLRMFCMYNPSKK